MRHDLVLSPRARRMVDEELPAKVALAAIEFMNGALLDAPYRVGKPLVGALAGHHVARRGQYRVVYRVDDASVTVLVVLVAHRRHAYRR